MRNLPKATIYNQQYGNDKSGQSRRIHNRKCPVKIYIETSDKSTYALTH